MSLIKKIIDLILYGNFWIATAAMALTFQTQIILQGAFELTPLAWFVFFSTFLLYALHRIVGILRLKDFLEIERYSVINQFRHHIIYYAIAAAIGAVYFFFRLDQKVQLALIIPAILSLGYVFPFFGKKRRLRDFDQIKIYLIALVWSFVTVLLPFIESGQSWNLSIILLFIERALFIFAITLPFDIRDLQVDDHSDVKTIPAMIGVIKTKQLAYIILAFTMMLILINYSLFFYDFSIFLGLGVSILSTAWLISFSKVDQHDYFYSGVLDGTMLLQFIFVWIAYSLI